MVVIRLTRTGANQRPFYHVVVTDSRHARDSGNYIERLGYYNPIAVETETALSLDQARIDYWLSVGAQPSDRVKSLFKAFKKGNVMGEKHEPKGRNTASPKKKAEAAAEEAGAESAE